MSAGFAAAAGGFSCIELAKAGPIQVPTIDKLSVRVPSIAPATFSSSRLKSPG
jgi:hypothetical protein